MNIISNCYIKYKHNNKIESAFFVLHKKRIRLTTKELSIQNKFIGNETTAILVSKDQKNWYSISEYIEILKKTIEPIYGNIKTENQSEFVQTKDISIIYTIQMNKV